MYDNEETLQQYKEALKKARKTFARDLRQGKSTHLKVLDELVNLYDCNSESLGEIDVPAELIIGTKTAARKNAFSSDFMPLFKPASEFAAKWRAVCSYHLSETGICEAPEAYEYLGKFYISEGNKRVSVLKSYDAPFITLSVTRLIPMNFRGKEAMLYKEFLEFYKVSKLYSIQFTKTGGYRKLLALMGFEKDYCWNRMDRIQLVGFFGRLKKELERKHISGNDCDCLLAAIEMNGYQNALEMKDESLHQFVSENQFRLNQGHGFYRIQCISDEENIGLYSGCAKDELKDMDFILSCGDLKSEYLEYLVTLSNKPLFYIHGNHDSQYDNNPPGGCQCIDDDLIVYKGLRIVGIGGSYRYSQDKYQYTELQMQQRLNKLKWKIRKAGGVDIIISHAPIRGYGDLPDYAHQGFECFIPFLYEFHPRYWFFGHVHMRYNHNLQRVYQYKNTTIVNVSDRYEVKF